MGPHRIMRRICEIVLEAVEAADDRSDVRNRPSVCFEASAGQISICTVSKDRLAMTSETPTSGSLIRGQSPQLPPHLAPPAGCRHEHHAEGDQDNTSDTFKAEVFAEEEPTDEHPGNVGYPKKWHRLADVHPAQHDKPAEEPESDHGDAEPDARFTGASGHELRDHSLPRLK